MNRLSPARHYTWLKKHKPEEALKHPLYQAELNKEEERKEEIKQVPIMSPERKQQLILELKTLVQPIDYSWLPKKEAIIKQTVIEIANKGYKHDNYEQILLPSLIIIPESDNNKLRERFFYNPYTGMLIDQKFYYIHYKEMHRIVYQWWYGCKPEIVDHINGDHFDNRIHNLRSVTYSQNSLNKEKRRMQQGFTELYMPRIYSGIELHLHNLTGEQQSDKVKKQREFINKCESHFQGMTTFDKPITPTQLQSPTQLNNFPPNP